MVSWWSIVDWTGLCYTFFFFSKRLEPRSIISLSRVIVRPITRKFNWPITSITRDINTTHWRYKITLTLKITSAQVVETSVTVTNDSFQNYAHLGDHTRPLHILSFEGQRAVAGSLDHGKPRRWKLSPLDRMFDLKKKILPTQYQYQLAI